MLPPGWVIGSISNCSYLLWSSYQTYGVKWNILCLIGEEMEALGYELAFAKPPREPVVVHLQMPGLLVLVSVPAMSHVDSLFCCDSIGHRLTLRLYNLECEADGSLTIMLQPISYF